VTEAASGRVVVVGGGLAGISAALACADRGADVTMLEARPRLGGAVFSFRRAGLVVDNGQHVFLRCCTAYRDFLRRIGSEPLTTLQERLAIPVIDPGGRTGWIRRGRLPAPLHLAQALLRYPFIGVADRARVGRAARALARLDPADRAIDSRTFGAWLREHGQSEVAVAALWELFALPSLNLSMEEASLALAAKVFQTGLLVRRDAADIGYAMAPLGTVHGDAAHRALRAAGVEVRLRSPAGSIEVEGDQHLVAVAGREPIPATAVVVAVPHDRVHTVLPPGALPQADRLFGLGSSPIVNVHVVYDRAVTNLAFAAGLRTPVQWVFDRTAASGLGRGQYLAVSVSGADREIDRPTGELRALFLPALERMFPRARDANVESFFVTRERAATFRQSAGTAALRPGPVTAIPGLYLAGAYTDTGWPATMEGAVRSGLTAARHVLAFLDRARVRREEVAA
jgi:squalene-associated FAD-dependent desaturase